MKFKPWNYQQKAAQHIIDNTAAGLFLDMGLGKTVTTLTAIQLLLKDYFSVTKVLVVAPLRVAQYTWPTEIEKWDHTKDLSFSVVIGTVKQRITALKKDADIYIINREQIPWLVNLYRKLWPFDMVVLDELSSFKNPKSQRFRMLKKVRQYIKRIVGLTGTPASNGLMDLWSEMYLLDEGASLGKTLTCYRDAYFVPGRRNNNIIYEWLLKPGADEQIYNRIKDTCISMKMEDYLEMPNITIYNRQIVLPDSVKKQISILKRDYICKFESTTHLAANSATLGNMLQQIADGALYVSENKYEPLHNEKIEELRDIVEAAQGDPILCYYWFVFDKDRLANAFPGARFLETKEDIDDWNQGKIKLMFANPASAGHGLNLQFGGHIIVWFSIIWNLEYYLQANARLVRQGQEKPVQIYHLIAADTIDERILKALRNKNLNQETLLEAVKAQVS